MSTKVNPCVWTPSNDTVVLKQISQQNIIAAIDNSGSTQAYDFNISIINSQYTTLLAFGAAFEHRVMLWNGGLGQASCSNVASVKNIFWESTGSTEPEWIFLKNAAAIEQSETLLLMTDGQIPPYAVENVRRLAAVSLTHITLIVVITVLGDRTQFVTRTLDSSVVAPFRDVCRDVIVCVSLVEECGLVPSTTRSANVRVLETKGIFAETWPSKDIVHDKTTLGNLTPVFPHTIASVVTQVRERPPPNFVPLGAVYVHLPSFIATDAVFSLNDNVIELVQAAQSANLLDQLQARCREYKTENAAEALRQAEKQDDESRLVNAIRHAKISGNEGISEDRVQLRALRVQRAEAASAVTTQFRKLVTSKLTIVERVLAAINEVRAVGYGADARTRMTNRVRAARLVDDCGPVDYDDTDALVGECSICCCECGPDLGAVLVVRVRRLDVELAKRNVQRNDPVTGARALGDAIQTMPLAFGSAEHNQVILPDEPMCLACARKYDISVLTREQVATYVPCVSLRVDANRVAVANRLAEALGGGRIMAAWTQLYTAIVDHTLASHGFASPIDHPEMAAALVYQREQLLNATHTNVTLQANTVHRTTLGEAIANVLSGLVMCDDSPTMPYVHRYFGEGVVRMLRLVPRDSGSEHIVRRAIVTSMVTVCMARLKHKTPNDFLTRVFRTRHGVPVAGSAHLVTLDDLRSLLPANFVAAIGEYCALYKVAIEHVFCLPALTLVWWRLSKKVAPLGVEAMMRNMTETVASATLVASPTETSSADAVAALNAHYERDLAASHAAPVPFASAVGPSKVACSACGYRFLEGTEVTEASVIAARQRRANHFARVYSANSSGNPGAHSSHYNLHMAVQRTYSATSTRDEHVQRVIKYVCVHNRRGNVYSRDMESEVAAAVLSFEPFADAYLRLVAATPARITYADALRYELTNR